MRSVESSVTQFFVSTEVISVLLVLLLSVSFNLSYINWGLPGLWHPDEITSKSARLVLARTFNPEFFAYPSLQIYFVAALVVGPYVFARGAPDISGAPLDSRLDSAVDKIVPEVTLYARAITALMGSGTVLAVFLVARRLFDRRTALLSALFLSVSAGFVGLSHFATVDIPLTFWFTLAFLCCVRALESGTRARLVVASLVTGLAASTKYTAVLLLPALLLSYFLTPRILALPVMARVFRKDLAYMMLALVLGFMMGTPYAAITPLEFLRQFVRLNLYQPTYVGVGQRGFVPHLANLFEIHGPFLFAASLLGFAYLLYLFARTRRYSFLLPIVTVLVVYLAMGRMMFYPQRYIILLAPFLSICAGKLFSDALVLDRMMSRGAVVILLAVTVGFGLYYSATAVLQMKNDDRNLAHRWVLENIDRNDTVEMTRQYGINVPDGYLHFEELPYSHFKETKVRMEDNPVYQRLKGLYWKLRAVSEQAVREAAAGTVSSEPVRTEPRETSLESLLERKPRYLILSYLSYGRFLSKRPGTKERFPLQNELYRSVLSGETPYRLVADFRKTDSWATPELEFVNGGITIYKYEHQSGIGRGSHRR